MSNPQTGKGAGCLLLIACILFILVGTYGCTNAGEATRILTENGYTDITITGYSWFACSEDDSVHTGFIAVSPNGHRVEGTVCSGLLFKNSTIRFK